MPVRVPEVRWSIRVLKIINVTLIHHFLTKMSFNFADAHCNVNIHNCLDSGSFGDTLKATQSLGLRFTTHSQK